MAAAARRWVTVPMPPATTIHVPSAPGSRHMLCTSRLCPLPAVSHPPFSPLKPSVVCASKVQASVAGAVVALQQHMHFAIGRSAEQPSKQQPAKHPLPHPPASRTERGSAPTAYMAFSKLLLKPKRSR